MPYLLDFNTIESKKRLLILIFLSITRKFADIANTTQQQFSGKIFIKKLGNEFKQIYCYFSVRWNLQNL